MRGPYRPGWYRRHADAAHVVHKVVCHDNGDGGQAWLTCAFDTRHGYPCGNGYALSAEAWRSFSPGEAPVHAAA